MPVSQRLKRPGPCRFAALLVVGLALASGGWAANGEVVNWYRYDLPPYHILRGEHARTGPLDHMFKVWKETLPGRQHLTHSVNITRMSREFRSRKDHRCITGSFIFPESRSTWLWSRPIYVEPPAVIVTRHDTWERWGRPQSIDFRALLANGEFRFGHFDRIYGGLIDRQITDAKDRDHVLTVASHASGESLMKMLHRGRVDYILAYLPEIRWLSLSRQMGYAEDFVTVLVENHATLSPVHVGCVDTPWGRATMEKLNSAITPEMRQQVWEHYQRWLSNPKHSRYFEQTQTRYFAGPDR